MPTLPMELHLDHVGSTIQLTRAQSNSHRSTSQLTWEAPYSPHREHHPDHMDITAPHTKEHSLAHLESTIQLLWEHNFEIPRSIALIAEEHLQVLGAEQAPPGEYSQ